MKNWVTILLLFLSNNLHGEINTDFSPRDYSIVPGSPQVAGLVEKIEYPVDYFHGTPTINLPIYTLKCGEIEIPLLLSYSSGGIRVEQKVSNAGLGWTLFSGAAISHTVQGAPDDANEKIHGLWHLNADEDEFRQRLIAKQPNYDPTNGSHYSDNLSWEASKGKRYYEGLTDVANDMFHLSGLGLSATFSVMKNGKIISSSDHPIKISKYSQSNHWLDGGCDNYGFKVESNSGLTYDFSTQDRTKYNYSYGNPLLAQSADSLYYASAWHINSVRDLSGNIVKYNYAPGKTFIIKDLGHVIALGYSNNTLSGSSPSHTSSVSGVKYFTQQLVSIEASGLKIEFDYLTPETSESDALIKTITVTSPDNEKRVFEFKYTGSLLSQVTDQGDLVYSFEYYLNNGFQPNTIHPDQDFGGYPNGAGNSFLVPLVSQWGGQIGWNSDRSVNPDCAIEGSLRKITYATGGHTEFQWESNTFSYLKSLPYTPNINSSQTTSIKTDTIRACRETGYEKLKISQWQIRQDEIAQLDLTQYFNMNPANLFGSAYDDAHHYDVYPEHNPPHYPHIVIRDHNTSEIANVYYLDKSTIERDGKKEVLNLMLAPGAYDFELLYPYEVDGAEDFIESEFRYHDGNSGYVYVRRISTDLYQTSENQNWCGLRIKRIISCAGNDENDILRKDFYYNFSADPHATSGTIQLVPRYDYQYYKKFPCVIYPGFDGSEVYCVGETAFPQTAIGSFSNIEYPEVMVCMGREDRFEPDSYLRYFTEIYSYSSSRNESFADYNRSQFLSFQPVGARMYTSRSHMRGNLIQKRFSPTMASNYIDYSYNIFENSDLEILTTDAFPICDFTSAPGDNTYGMYDYGISTYTLIPYNKTIAYEGVVNEDGIKSYKKYDYFYTNFTENLDWNLVKSLTVNSSEFGNIVTHFTYPRKESLYLPHPETEIATVGNEIISATRTEYDPVTFLPVRKYTLSKETPSTSLIAKNQSTTPLQKELINKPTYEYRYNGNGNIIQISYNGKPLASYIWGYNGLYPVIEATDTDYDTLESLAVSAGLSKDEISGRKIYSESVIKSISESLRKSLPHSNISAISYHWLFGVAKITSPQGTSSSFSYDPRGRLTEVRDFNSHIINKYEYHYGENQNW